MKSTICDSVFSFRMAYSFDKLPWTAQKMLKYAIEIEVLHACTQTTEDQNNVEVCDNYTFIL